MYGLALINNRHRCLPASKIWCGTMTFGNAKVLADCKPMYYRISECAMVFGLAHSRLHLLGCKEVQLRCQEFTGGVALP